MTYSPRSTAGLPRGLIPSTYRRQKRCSRRCRERHGRMGKYMPLFNIDELAAKPIPDLIKLLSSMHTGLSGSVVGAQEDAFRQAIQCLIEEKLLYRTLC